MSLRCLSRTFLLLSLVLVGCRSPETPTQTVFSPAPPSPSRPPGTATPSPNPPTASPSPRPLPTASATPEPSLTPTPGSLVFPPYELVSALAWSPDGEMLAVSRGDTVAVYRYPALEVVGSYLMGALTHGLAFSPDGSLLATGSHDGVLRVWSLSGFRGEQPEPILEIAAHRKGTNQIAFHPRDDLLATAGNDGIVRVWDTELGEKRLEMIAGSFAVPSIVFAPNAEWLAMMNGRVIRLRELSEGRITGTIHAPEELFSMAVSRDGAWLAAGGHSGEAYLWSSPLDGDGVGPRVLPHNDGDILIWAVAFHPGASVVATAGGDGRVALWSTEDGSSLDAFPAHAGAATALAFRPDGSVLASGGLDSAVHFWMLGASGERK